MTEFRAENRGGIYVVAVEGLSALRALEDIPANVKRAALQAVNRTADRTRTAAARRMREQVNWRASYLSPSQGRFNVTERARADSLEARITARQRPTSLASFSTGTVGGKNGVTVQVAPGFAKLMKRAFLVRLRVGSLPLDTRSNLGLAIRLKPGERVDNKRVMIPLRKGSNVYLLYGPSVDQVFRSVAGEVAPDAAEFLESEFLRLMELDRNA
jgi:hypothetical protein